MARRPATNTNRATAPKFKNSAEAIDRASLTQDELNGLLDEWALSGALDDPIENNQTIDNLLRRVAKRELQNSGHSSIDPQELSRTIETLRNDFANRGMRRVRGEQVGRNKLLVGSPALRSRLRKGTLDAALEPNALVIEFFIQEMITEIERDRRRAVRIEGRIVPDGTENSATGQVQSVSEDTPVEIGRGGTARVIRINPAHDGLDLRTHFVEPASWNWVLSQCNPTAPKRNKDIVVPIFKHLLKDDNATWEDEYKARFLDRRLEDTVNKERKNTESQWLDFYENNDTYGRPPKAAIQLRNIDESIFCDLENYEE